jgi:quinol-cytochrome oxidoreductase complex cytochrome b subunit
MAATREEEYHQRYEGFKREGHQFWPNIIVEDTLAAALVLLCTIGLMVTLGVPTEGPADPTDTAYVPRPEWYFMFLFQFLKYFPGNLEWVAAVVIPSAVLLVILLLPVYDRGPNRAPWRRPLAMIAGLVMSVVVGYLTYVAYQ